jgi:hypothetical protein
MPVRDDDADFLDLSAWLARYPEPEERDLAEWLAHATWLRSHGPILRVLSAEEAP